MQYHTKYELRVFISVVVLGIVRTLRDTFESHHSLGMFYIGNGLMASAVPCSGRLAAALNRAGHALANRQNVYAFMLHEHNVDLPVVNAYVGCGNTQDPAVPLADSPLSLFDGDSELWSFACALQQGSAFSPAPDARAMQLSAKKNHTPRDQNASDLRAALRERLLQRANNAEDNTLYEYFCDGCFFPCLIVEAGAMGSGAKSNIDVYMGNKNYVVEFKACERTLLVRSAYSCVVTRRNESLRDVARRTKSTQVGVVRLNRHVAGLTCSSRFEAGVILRTGRR